MGPKELNGALLCFVSCSSYALTPHSLRLLVIKYCHKLLRPAARQQYGYLREYDPVITSVIVNQHTQYTMLSCVLKSLQLQICHVLQ